MPEDASVSGWLDGLGAGDEADIQRLWDRYFQQLVRLAGKNLPGHARREFDQRADKELKAPPPLRGAAMVARPTRPQIFAVN